jgi:hypothetical protein
MLWHQVFWSATLRISTAGAIICKAVEQTLPASVAGDAEPAACCDCCAEDAGTLAAVLDVVSAGSAAAGEVA